MIWVSLANVGAKLGAIWLPLPTPNNNSVTPTPLISSVSTSFSQMVNGSASPGAGGST
jgi:hypothetical protein